MNTSLKIAAVAMLAGAYLAIGANAARAYAPEPDLMKIKGYSPEIIDVTETQRSRQEWREPPAPTLSPVEKFFHNIYYNNWTGSVDDFGSEVIRDKY